MPDLPKLLAKMKNNPKNNWVIDDLISVTNKIGLSYRKPSGGSHFVFSSEYLVEHLTVPAHKPIKPIYIKNFVVLCVKHINIQSGSHDL